MKQNNLVAVILAGGIGVRFWPMTTYKPMVRFFDKTMLEHTLESVRLSGIETVVVVTNPQDASFVSSLQIPGMSISVVIQEKALGMADAVLCAAGAVGSHPCLIMNAGDIVDDALYTGLLKQIDGKSALIVGKKVSSYFPGGYLQIKNSMLDRIVEKPGAGNEPSDFINLVYHYFPEPSEFFNMLRLTKSAADDVYEKALSLYAATHPVRVVAYTGQWNSLKYPWDVLTMLKILLLRLVTHKEKHVVIKNNVIIEGPVFIEDGVTIFEHTKIVGPCYIGKNTIIGNNCIIRSSHIGADCVVGFNSDITRSYIGDYCWFHSNYVGDSVLEGNISMGSGAVLANLRLDDGEVILGRNKLGAMIGKGVRIGVNASIMPGVKIGHDSFIGSGVVLDKDLPDTSFCVAKAGYTITKNKTIAPTSRESFKKKI